MATKNKNLTRTKTGRESPAESRYSALVQKLLFQNKKVSFPKDRKGFGSSALWTAGKMFAFLSSKDQLVVKLPSDRIDSLIESGYGERCIMGEGRIMKQWFAINEKSDEMWLPLVEESMEFVMS